MAGSPRHLLISALRAGSLPADAEVAVAGGHVKERLLEIDPTRKVSVLPIEPDSRDAFSAAAAFERAKYESYVPILAERLNRVHGMDRSEEFWDKVIGFTLLMHVSNCRRMFAVGQIAAGGEYEFSVLSTESFKTQSDEESYRQYHQASDLGDEQLFAAFMLLTAGPGRHGTFAVNDAAGAAYRPPGGPRAALRRRARGLGLRLSDDALWPVKELAAALVKRASQPTVLVVQSLWSPRAKQRIQLRSRGRVVVDDRPISYPRSREARPDQREVIAASPADADAFDRYVFHTLRWAAPRSWIEDFPVRLAQTESALDQRRSVRYIANETLDEGSSLLLAAARDRGITSLHYEHNYLQHQFIGNVVWFLLRKVDVYLSLGWSSRQSAKIVPSGSLFPWTSSKRAKKDIDLLFIATAAMVRPPIASSGYGEAGSRNAAGYCEMTRRFLSGLSPSTLSKVYYRDYPAAPRAMLYVHPLDTRLLDAFEGRLGHIDRDGLARAVTLMSRSRLVVVNYLSTPYNQALLAGIPTVVLFNADAYYLTDDAADFYAELVATRVFHTDPAACATFVEDILDDPDRWWQSEPVRRARANYLNRNFGRPEALEQYLIRAANSADTLETAVRLTHIGER